MESEAVKFMHSGVEVVYWERENEWRFTLRGRDRKAENPLKAKEAIDKPVPEDKAKPFERIKAFKLGNWDTAPTWGDITSVAETDYRGDAKQVWFSGSNGRGKENPNSLYADTPENRELVRLWLGLKEQVTQLNAQAAEKISLMAKVAITVPQ